jgi:biofilm PGA synthesis N-glycosyltransferase PgaC
MMSSVDIKGNSSVILPMRWSGLDCIAVQTARLRGWGTRSLGEEFFYHRAYGCHRKNTWKAKFDYGRKDYFLGNHPLWQIFRISFQMMKRPYVPGGVGLLSGYFYSLASPMERPIEAELLKFHRKEQLSRLKRPFARS